VSDLIYQDWDQVQCLNEDRLTRMGVSPQVSQAFRLNRAYSETRQTRLIAALDHLQGLPMTDTDPRLRRHYRVAFVATAMLLVGIVVTLPFSLASVLDEVLGLTTGKVLPLLRPEGAAIAPAHSRLHLAVTQIDEVHLIATLRLSGHRTCGLACTGRDRLLFVSAAPHNADAEGLPPSASITLPETTEAVTETFQLPLSGVPIRYPFDAYHLILAVALQRVHPDGSIRTVTSRPWGWTRPHATSC
jgi:hypothetical protein